MDNYYTFKIVNITFCEQASLTMAMFDATADKSGSVLADLIGKGAKS